LSRDRRIGWLAPPKRSDAWNGAAAATYFLKLSPPGMSTTRMAMLPPSAGVRKLSLVP
jgi:hypothetical protein